MQSGLWPSRSHYLGMLNLTQSFWTALKLLHQLNSAPLCSLHVALHPPSPSGEPGVCSRAVPEITMHQCCLLGFREMQRQPLDEPLHRWDNVSFCSSILLRPALNLLLNIITCNGGYREGDWHKEASEEIHKSCVQTDS